MAYIAGLIIVGLFFLALKYFTQLSKEQEIIVSLITLSIVLGAIAFNAYSSAQRENLNSVVAKYKQGKSVMCSGVEVNASLYSLSIGTYTFIGKAGTPNYTQMISASTCE